MYESFYGLKAKPFRLTPDTRYFFGSRGHKRALAYLRYGLSQSEGFIVITGEIGTGKTTLVRMLCDELTTDEFVIAQIVTTQLNGDDTLRLVVNAFGIPIEGSSKSFLLASLETFLERQVRQSRRVLLVVDEVQNLSPQALEELRMLSNFTVDGHQGLQTFLLGQAEFRQTLQSPVLEQFRQRVIAACHLSPLLPEETRTYIEHRLRLAGWTQYPQFEEGIFDDIHELTKGVPRRINTLLDRMLLFGFLEERKVIDFAILKTVVEELEDEIPVKPATPAARIEQAPNALLDNEFVSLNDLYCRIVALENQIHALGSSLNKVVSVLRRIGRQSTGSPPVRSGRE